MLAVGEGYDAIAFLDGDNWYAPDHIERCVQVAREQEVDFVTSRRHWARADDRVGRRGRGRKRRLRVDTNCSSCCAAPSTASRAGPDAQADDDVVRPLLLGSLRGEGLIEADTGMRTVFYLCTWANIYATVGEKAPEFAKSGLPVHELTNWYKGLTGRDREIVFRLTGYMLPAHA